jgi:uncharacterized membrane protein
MRRSLAAAAAAAALAAGACQPQPDAAEAPVNGADPTAANLAATAPANAASPADPNAATPGANSVSPAAGAVVHRWDLQSSGEGVALVLSRAGGGTEIRLFCPANANRLLVNVPGFRPIGSEERLSFGGGGNVTALVADTRGDRQRGGVSGTGAVPDDLAALVSGPLSASYGAQRIGPLPAAPAQQRNAFVAACRERAAVTPTPTPSAGPAGACMMQGTTRLTHGSLRAVGTEPFWGARIQGRCVTYSHPDDQSGTRVWTRYAATPGGGTWTGALNGRPFVLRTRAAPGCSDGMSDRRYPIAVTLTVSGERRTGCAEPA